MFFLSDVLFWLRCLILITFVVSYFCNICSTASTLVMLLSCNCRYLINLWTIHTPALSTLNIFLLNKIDRSTKYDYSLSDFKLKDNAKYNQEKLWTIYISNTLCLNQKFTLFIYFCDNFPNCEAIQIIFGRNIAEKIWNKQTHGNFETCYVLLLYIIKWHPFFFQFHNVKILMSHFGQYLYNDDTVIEAVFFLSVNRKCH